MYYYIYIYNSSLKDYHIAKLSVSLLSSSVVSNTNKYWTYAFSNAYTSSSFYIYWMNKYIYGYLSMSVSVSVLMNIFNYEYVYTNTYCFIDSWANSCFVLCKYQYLEHTNIQAYIHIYIRTSFYQQKFLCYCLISTEYIYWNTICKGQIYECIYMDVHTNIYRWINIRIGLIYTWQLLNMKISLSKVWSYTNMLLSACLYVRYKHELSRTYVYIYIHIYVPI